MPAPLATTRAHATGPPFDPLRSWAALAEVAAAGHAGAAALEALRRSRLATLVEAARRSPVYRPLLAGRSSHDWRLEDLPIQRKADLMARFDDWVTEPAVRLADVQRFVQDRSRIGDAFLGRYAVWESSGSSGAPAIFVNDARSLAVYDALETLRRCPPRPLARLLDPLFLAERIAFAGATDGHFASTASMERLRRLNPLLAPRLRSFSFLDPLPVLAAELAAFAPTILSTYPSTALILAEERLAGRLDIAPREIWTGGETLTQSMQAVLRQAFDCPASNDYGCSEFLSLATQCRHGALHVNSDWAILESVDERGRPVPADATGTRCLLTNLANHVQPLIRYDLGDRLRIRAQPCPCGSALPVIEVEGRSDDSLRLGQGRDRIHVSPLALSTVLEAEAGLFDFQLVQHGPRQLELTTRLHGPASRLDLRRGQEALQSFFARQGLRDVAIHCHCGEPLRQARSGKVKRIVAAVD